MRVLLHRFDRKVTATVQAWPEWVRPIMRFATLVGQPVFTVGAGALIAGAGWGKSDLRLVELGIGAIILLFVGMLLKLFLRRKRPLTEYVATMWFKTFSFPSGHAVGSVGSYGAVVIAAALYVPLSVAWTAGLFFGAIVALIGISRVYLGAHYPSDVIAGWLLGGIGLVVLAGIV